MPIVLRMQLVQFMSHHSSKAVRQVVKFKINSFILISYGIFTGEMITSIMCLRNNISNSFQQLFSLCGAKLTTK